MSRSFALLGLLVWSLSLGCTAEPSPTTVPVTTVAPVIETGPSIRIDHNPTVKLGGQSLQLYNIECAGIELVEAELVAVIAGQPHPLITVSAKPKRDGTSRGQLLVVAQNDRAVPADIKLMFGDRIPNAYTVHDAWPELPAELPFGSSTSGILDKQITVIHGRGMKDELPPTDGLSVPDQSGPDRLLITLRWEAVRNKSE